MKLCEPTGSGLIQHIEIFQGVFLHKAGDQMHGVFCEIFERIVRGEVWQDAAELTSLLHSTLLATSWRHLRTHLKVRVDSSATPETGASEAGTRQTNSPVGLSLSVVEAIHLEYDVSWPMSLIIGPSTQEDYSEIFTFLLKIKWASQAQISTPLPLFCFQNGATNRDFLSCVLHPSLPRGCWVQNGSRI